MKTTESIIEKLNAHITSECSAIDTDTLYDEIIDECYSFDSVGGIFAGMSPSRVLKECDPIAYRCGKNDWLDGGRDSIIEVDDTYYDAREVEKAKEDFVGKLEAEISDLETEIEDLEAEEDEDNLTEVVSKTSHLNDLRADLATVEEHSF